MRADPHFTVAAGDGTILAYRDIPPAAEEQGTIVLLHSLGADGQMWNDCVDRLRVHHRLVLPDARGHGASGASATASVDMWVNDLEVVLAAADVGPVLLAGVSMGGIQALAYAAAHPGQVHALVIADSFAALPAEVSEAKIAALAGRARTSPMPRVAEEYLAETFSQPFPTSAGTVREALAGMDPDSYVAAVSACFGARIEDRLREVNVPTLVLWGERDTKTPRGLSERIAAGIPDARLQVLPDAGHLSNIDNPDAFATELLQFAAAHVPETAPARAGGEQA